MENKFKKSLMITGAPATGKTTLIQEVAKSENLKLKPEHTTREKRFGEIDGLDKVFLSVEQFIEKYNLGWYIEPSLDFAMYNGNYYGTPIQWIGEIKDGEERIAFISVSVEMGKKIKLALKNNILWVHLIANESKRKDRLQQRGTNQGQEMEKRLNGGDSQGPISDADIMIDTSTISIEQALKIIREELYVQ